MSRVSDSLKSEILLVREGDDPDCFFSLSNDRISSKTGRGSVPNTLSRLGELSLLNERLRGGTTTANESVLSRSSVSDSKMLSFLGATIFSDRAMLMSSRSGNASTPSTSSSPCISEVSATARSLRFASWNLRRASSAVSSLTLLVVLLSGAEAWWMRSCMIRLSCCLQRLCQRESVAWFNLTTDTWWCIPNWTCTLKTFLRNSIAKFWHQLSFAKYFETD